MTRNEQLAFLKRLWLHDHDDGLAFLAHLDRTTPAGHRWRDEVVDPRASTLGIVQGFETDLFFTPLTFTSDKRSNDSAYFPSSVFFADLDEGFDEEALNCINPTYMWRTSRGNYQAIWIANTPFHRNEWNRINQALTAYMHADAGGWHASKVLRVPGSINYKRNGTEVSDLLIKARPIETKRLLAIRDAADIETVSVAVAYGPIPYSMVRVDWVNLFKAYWDIMPLGVRSRLLAPAVHDRSLELFMLSRDLLKLGLNASEVFHLLSGVKYNKFRDRPEVLWKMVNE